MAGKWELACLRQEEPRSKKELSGTPRRELHEEMGLTRHDPVVRRRGWPELPPFTGSCTWEW